MSNLRNKLEDAIRESYGVKTSHYVNFKPRTDALVEVMLDALLESLPNPKGLLQYVGKAPSREGNRDLGYNRAIDEITLLLENAKEK